MKKIILSILFLLTFCTSAFAYHVPNREEYTDIQRTFNGFYRPLSNNIDITERVTIYDNNFVMFMYDKKSHYIYNADIQVDYSNGFTVQFVGKCDRTSCDCQNQPFNVCVMQGGYDSRFYRQRFIFSVNKSLDGSDKAIVFSRLQA